MLWTRNSSSRSNQILLCRLLLCRSLPTSTTVGKEKPWSSSRSVANTTRFVVSPLAVEKKNMKTIRRSVCGGCCCATVATILISCHAVCYVHNLFSMNNFSTPKNMCEHDPCVLCTTKSSHRHFSRSLATMSHHRTPRVV